MLEQSFNNKTSRTTMDINKVIKHFGSQVALAEAIGTTQPTISNWKTRGKIPALQQLRIQEATVGKIKADRKILATK
jgi:DNA-binding transcriptional regulator YdaS (Cro superfamily)